MGSGKIWDHLNKSLKSFQIKFSHRGNFDFWQKIRTDIVMEACSSLNPAIDVGQVGPGPLRCLLLPEGHCGVGSSLLKSIRSHRAWYLSPSGWRRVYSGNGPLYHWGTEILPGRCPILARPRWVQNSNHHRCPRGVQCLPVAVVTKPANHLFLQGEHPKQPLCHVVDRAA